MARTPREACSFGLREALVLDGLCSLARLTGIWETPRLASGDLEDMTFLDKVYWLYKTDRPVRRAVRGSGLEEYFSRPMPSQLLPVAFAVSAELELRAVGDLST